jgi:hypothetical protein
MRKPLQSSVFGAAAVALGVGAAIASATPYASADPGRTDGTEAAQHSSPPDKPSRRGPVGQVSAPPAPAAATRPSARVQRNDVSTAVPAPKVTASVVRAAVAVAAPTSRAPSAPSQTLPQLPAAGVPAPVTPPATPAALVWQPAQPPYAAAQASAAQQRLWMLPAALLPTPLRSGSTGAAELSGITYAGGKNYYAVGDNGATTIWQLAAAIGTGLGWLWSGGVAGGVSAPGMGRDSEGIALRPGADSVWVTDELTSTVTEFSLSNGAKVGTVDVPEIYRPANVQGNFGLESLTYGAGKLWTANEEALKPDGSVSTTRSGSWVRIQEFGGADFTPGTQYAYKTDRIRGMSPFISVERSGLVDLLALPDGRVLALEREAGGFIPSFRSRIYQLDFTSATDVSTVPSLTDGGFAPVTKRLLWQGVFLQDNFEGMTLGPKLNNGGYSVLLVSDDGAGQAFQRQDLYNLVLFGAKDSTPVAV